MDAWEEGKKRKHSRLGGDNARKTDGRRTIAGVARRRMLSQVSVPGGHSSLQDKHEVRIAAFASASAARLNV